MSDRKSDKPRDNYGCFTAPGLGYWLDKARGLNPSFVRGYDGTRVEYEVDPLDSREGLALNNGGIISPRQDWLERGKLYFRFYSTQSHKAYGDNAWFGHWWIDQDSFSDLRAEAVETSTSLRVIASRRLALPAQWSDLHYVVCATPKTNLKAWAGRGKVAHAIGSPASKNRPKDGGLHGEAPHMSMRQLFVPGSVPHFGEYFHALGTARVFDAKSLTFQFDNGRDDVKWPGAKRGA